MNGAEITALVVRCGMVLLFMPFSALDKVVGFKHAVGQANEVFRPSAVASVVLLTGLLIEVFCSLGVVTGVSDRACAFLIAAYCAATAFLFKQFWRPGDFWINPDGKARGLFWDFLKNLSLGAAFLLIVVGADGSGLRSFVHTPLASTHPYRNAP